METIIKAKELFIAKKYKESFSLFKSMHQTSAEASYYLAMHYYLGLGVKHNYNKALNFFRKAWEGLYIEAIYMLGKMYELGQGVDSDIEIAFKYYQAGKESIKAKTRLAQMYEEGIGTEKNLQKAIRLYNELRKAGSGYAMYKIGRFYLTGHGLKKNFNSGYLWLRKALETDNILAINYFRVVGSKVASDSRTTEEILGQAKVAIEKEDKEFALSSLELAIKEGNKDALFILVDLYLRGKLVQKDLDFAFKLLLKHQDMNDGDIYYQIGQFYESGIGIISSYYKAAIYYEKASQLNHQPSKLALKDLRGY